MKIVDVLKRSGFCAKRMSVWVWTSVLSGLFVPSASAVSITSVTAQQRYPWNGLVDVVVTFQGSANEVSQSDCTFSAADSATKVALPLVHITRYGNDSGSGNVWTRRFIWDAAADVGTIKIDDVALVADVDGMGGVQLWEGGPCWAECNVGASKPEEHGYYFWWGDTVGCERNAANDGWISVKDGQEDFFDERACQTYGKSMPSLRSGGYIYDSRLECFDYLVSACDAATVQCGTPWYMPTDEVASALIDNCTTTMTKRREVWGLLVTGKGAYSSKSIFLPAAGFGYMSDISYTNTLGRYWCSMPDMNRSECAKCLAFNLKNSNDLSLNSGIRCYGYPVRPVRALRATHFALDCRTGVRVCSSNGEVLRYDASWCENGDTVRIADNGVVIKTGTVGLYTWHPAADSSLLLHQLKLEILSGGRVVGTETAQFNVGDVYTLKFDGNGGVGTMPDVDCLVNVEKCLPKNVFVCEGYAFVGWATTTGGAVVHADGALVSNLAPAGGSITLYAVWTAVAQTCTVTYKPGAYGSGFQQTATKVQGVALPLKGPIFTRSGYAQTGWTTSDGGAKIYDLGDICNVDTPQTLYPCWSLPNSASDFTYEIYNDEARIRGYVGSRKDVVVPSSLGGYSVASVLFENCKEISSVTMPSSVQKVSSYDFNYCYGLRAVVLGQGVTEVDRGAFFRCTNLVYLSLSADVTNIKCGSFVDCPNLIQIDVDPGNKSFRSNGPIVSSKDGKTLVWYPSATGEVRVSPEVTEIGDGAFAGTRDLKSVMIPSGVTRIGNRAFSGCTSLMPPQLPTSLRTIGDETFYCCYGLQSLEIPAGVESIGEMAFYNCYKLESLRIAASVTNIDYRAFQDCKKLGDGLVIVDGCLLTVNGDCPSSVIIPSGVRLVAGGSFYRRSTLKSATIPSSVKILCRGAFDQCENLSAVMLNEGLEVISDDCFNRCSALKSVVIPSSVKHIGANAFLYCSGLESLTLKEGLQTIGLNAFWFCRGLYSVVIPASVSFIGDSAFGDLDACEFTFAGPPPGANHSPFDARARGVYASTYAQQWQSVIVDKCWNGLAMRCQGEEWVDFPTSIAIVCASTELESGSQSVCACAAMMQSQSWVTKRVEPEWSVDVGGDVISVLPGGLLDVGYVTEPRQVVIRATYTEGGVTKTTTATLTILPKSAIVTFDGNDGTPSETSRGYTVGK